VSAPVNLNRARKDRAKEQAKKQADTNAAKFGRTLAEKASDKAEIARNAKILDGAKRDS